MMTTLSTQKYAIQKQVESSTQFLRTIGLVNRLMKDEWEMFLYSKFDADGDHNAYRYGIRDAIADVFRKIKRSYAKIGFIQLFESLDADSCDRADDIYDTIETAKNRIKTKLIQNVSYKYVDGLTGIVMTYIFATLGNSIICKTAITNAYSEILDKIEEYTRVLDIDLFRHDEGVVFVDDDTADMIVRKILTALKSE